MQRSWLRRKHGPLVVLLDSLFGHLRCASVGWVVGKCIRRLLRKNPEKEKWRDLWIDGYVVVGLGVEVALLLLLLSLPCLREKPWWRPGVAAFLGYRVSEVFVTGCNVMVFDWLRDRTPLKSVERSLVLQVVNYVEIIVIFAVLNFLFVVNTSPGGGPAFGTAGQALEHSVRVATLMGDGLPEGVWTGGVTSRLLFISEAALAVMFLLFVLARAISLIPPRTGRR